MNDLELSCPISVIVPLFNRIGFLPQLLNTLASQTFKQFEVIFIDDGSTDDTSHWIAENFESSGIFYKYIFQENGGPYKARNNGLLHASGEYIVLFDSDDEWPTYHLAEFYHAMIENPDIDWLFGSIKRIDHSTRVVLENSNLETNLGKLHPIISLNTEIRRVGNEKIFVIDDIKLPETMIAHTLPGSMQCSIIKRAVFDSHIFDESFRTTYDRFYCMKTAIKGFKFAYSRKTHLIYHVHDDNISTVGIASSEKIIRSAKTMLIGYKQIADYALNKKQRLAAVKRISEVNAWELAIAHQAIGSHGAAIRCFHVAARLQPFNLVIKKSLLAAYLKKLVQPLLQEKKP